jgi:dTMP kinase
MTGRFITLEGGEGAGKSTQARRLATWLAELGVEVVTTREPGGSVGAEAIRAVLVSGDAGRWDALTEALLHNAARRDHLRALVRPALARGAWVVCDRFADSTLAYQGFGQGLSLEILRALQALVIEDCRPDLTLLLDVPVGLGIGRAVARDNGEDRYERMGRAFHEKLRQGFLDLAAGEPQRFAVIDATGTVDAVTADIRHVISQRLPLTALA